MSIKNSALLRGFIVGAAAVLTIPAALAADVTGAGSSFYYPIAAKWAAEYKAKSGVGLNYQSIGSGGGIKAIKAKTVTFGASDKPLKPQELADAGLIQFPAVMGGVVPVVNLKGIAPGELTLDANTLTGIFLGQITKWDDKAIKAQNPTAKLPSSAIAVVHRSDGSGTTFLFTDYLSKTNSEWREKVGADSAVDWPVGLGAKGNEGVAGQVTQVDGAIGYVEYAYAKQNKMTYAKMVNKSGTTVSPSAETFAAAASNADWAGAAGFYLILTNQPGAQSWPITGAPFVIMQKTAVDPAATLEALKFFDWTYKNGAKAAGELDYVPMPEKVVDLIEASWKSNLKDASGQAVWK